MTIVGVIIRLLLSVIFFRTAWHKFHDREDFQTELAAYQLIKKDSITFATMFLVVAETYTALMLLNITSFIGPLLAATLLLLYAGAMAINLRKGKTDISCGCSGPLFSHREAAKKMISWLLVLRNITLSCIAIFALPVSASTAQVNSSLLIIFSGTACALLMYEAVEQALANSQRYRQWLARQVVKA